MIRYALAIPFLLFVAPIMGIWCFCCGMVWLFNHRNNDVLAVCTIYLLYLALLSALVISAHGGPVEDIIARDGTNVFSGVGTLTNHEPSMVTELPGTPNALVNVIDIDASITQPTNGIFSVAFNAKHHYLYKVNTRSSLNTNDIWKEATPMFPGAGRRMAWQFVEKHTNEKYWQVQEYSFNGAEIVLGRSLELTNSFYVNP